MKNIATTILSFMLLITSIIMKAQDSIYFKNKSVVIAKISEVGATEIKYQHFNNLNGPNYIVAKSDILLIKYSNGYVDTINATSLSKPVDNLVVYNPVNTEEIKLFGSRMVYHGKTISDKKLNMMIINHPSPETKIELIKQMKLMNNYKINERALGPGLFVTGAIVHVAALGTVLFGRTSLTNYVAVSAFIVGAALRITGHVVHAVYKNKAKSKRIEIVDMYNEMR